MYHPFYVGSQPRLASFCVRHSRHSVIQDSTPKSKYPYNIISFGHANLHVFLLFATLLRTVKPELIICRFYICYCVRCNKIFFRMSFKESSAGIQSPFNIIRNRILDICHGALVRDSQVHMGPFLQHQMRSHCPCHFCLSFCHETSESVMTIISTSSIH